MFRVTIKLIYRTRTLEEFRHKASRTKKASQFDFMQNQIGEKQNT